MLLPHKDLDAFIKKYNSTFSMSGYSHMNLKDKNNLVESRVKAVMASKLRPNDARLIKAEYARIKSKHAEKMKKLDEDTKPKATPRVFFLQKFFFKNTSLLRGTPPW